MAKRGARPPLGKAGKEASVASSAGVERVRDAALSAGPQHLLRDLEAQRQAHLAARQEGRETSFHAFQALALCAAAARDQISRLRSEAGQGPIHDFATEDPRATFRIPAWAAEVIFEGWMRAVGFDLDGSLNRRPPVSLIEAFGLGGIGGGRTVALHHRNRDRDLFLALAIAEGISREPPLLEDTATKAVALDRGVSYSTAYEAWSKHKTLAMSILEASRNKRLGNPAAK